jgi:cell division protein FtsQ
MPVIRVKADNGEDYYVDEHGEIMPYTHYVNEITVATGAISKKYAQKTLTRVGNFLANNPLWRSQVEQINVLPDGTIEMVPRVGDHIVYLGKPFDLEQKFTRLEKFYRYGLSEAGWNKYSYISLEFRNQIICKKRNFKKTEIQ